MTPSEEVRKRLDELGIEHRDDDETISDGDGSDPYGHRHFTRWFHHGMECTFAHATHDGVWEATVFDGGLATGFTPAQAIAATVGVGTCHNVGDERDFCCSECGARMFIKSDYTYTIYTMVASDERTIIKRPKFCPNCGRRVEVDE